MTHPNITDIKARSSIHSVILGNTIVSKRLVSKIKDKYKIMFLILYQSYFFQNIFYFSSLGI